LASGNFLILLLLMTLMRLMILLSFIAPHNNMQRAWILAQTIGHTLSHDPHTKVGCLLIDGSTHDILSIGWNSFPDGVDDSDAVRWERPLKYQFVCHAEINAICRAARSGARIHGATCVITSFPCADCSRALIQAGMARLITTPLI
jgi:deoxycytidylate deaminase